MMRRILGLEIGHSNIKMLECRQKGGQFIIEKAQRIPTPKDSVTDGIINDVDQIYELINQEIKKNRYRARNLVIVIKSSEIITRDIKMDIMPKKDMEAILAIEYQEHLLVEVSKYQVTYKVLNDGLEGDTGQQEVQIVAAPNTIIDPLIEIAEKLRMRIRVINVASDAVADIFSQENEVSITNASENDLMVVDIGGKSTTATIISNGIGILNRDIPFGLDSINDILKDEFGSSDEELLEEFKQRYAGIYDEDSQADIYGQHISEVLKPMLQYNLIEGIKRLLQFHFSRGRRQEIEKIYIVGGGAYLKNIDKYMEHLLDIPCVLGVDLNSDKVEFPEEFQDESAYFANILGLVSKYGR